MIQGDQLQNPTLNDPQRTTNDRPGDNALVMAEANAVGFNELINLGSMSRSFCSSFQSIIMSGCTL